MIGPIQALDGDEVAWIQECKQGHRVAFEPLVRRYGPAAYRYALSLLRSPEDARDVSQESFMRAYFALHRFDDSRPFYPWFLTILRNQCMSHLRRRRPQVSLDDPDSGVQPSSRANAEAKFLMEQALDQLNANDREIVMLKEYQGLSYEQLSSTLGIPRGTVMSRLYYARRRLRAILAPVLGQSQEKGAIL